MTGLLQSDPLLMLGHPARLIIELEDGPHDISHLVTVATSAEPRSGGFFIDVGALSRELTIERRVRDRTAT